MKKLLLTLALLFLSTAGLMSPAAASISQIPATTVLYQRAEPQQLSLLIEGVEDFQTGDLELLSSYGALTTVVGKIAVLHAYRDDLSELVRLPFVSRIERSWPLTVDLDRSVPDIGANAVWTQVRDPSGRNVTGSGVIIGFVDTGIDVSHRDFTFPNGTTKILYVWDQTTPGRSPQGFGYGYECDSKVIEDESCPETDTFGHGTHVAGIAAGSGQATKNYTGVAPDASIIFVKSGHEICSGGSWTFDAAQILDGINYIVKKASSLGRRVVINLSLGGNIGGHDGSDPWEIGLDELVKRGVAVVVAAGNEALDHTHIRGQLTENKNVTFELSSKQSTTDLAIDIWYSLHDEIDATLTTPGGTTYSIPSSQGEQSINYKNVTGFAATSELGKELFFEVNSSQTLPMEGWMVTLTARRIASNGVWDAWVDTMTCTFPGAVFLPGNDYQIDKNITLGIPSTAHNVVTVGAYITKTGWTGMNGQTYGSSDLKSGGIAPFSSLGPTRDGRIKPDVVAPGMLIASARSNATALRGSDPDLFHRILAGTSMAAPHVAGVIALMLQYAPDLQATGLAATLSETARLDKNTELLTAGSPAWGFGKLDARAATGLFRVTLISNGLPSGVVMPVELDKTTLLNITSGSWVNLYFEAGTTHRFAMKQIVQGRNEEQYQLVKSGFFALTNPQQGGNYTLEESGQELIVSHTGYLAADYGNIIKPSPLIMILPATIFLALGIAAVTILLAVRMAVKARRKNRDQI